MALPRPICTHECQMKDKAIWVPSGTAHRARNAPYRVGDYALSEHLDRCGLNLTFHWPTVDATKYESWLVVIWLIPSSSREFNVSHYSYRMSLIRAGTTEQCEQHLFFKITNSENDEQFILCEQCDQFETCEQFTLFEQREQVRTLFGGPCITVPGEHGWLDCS